MDDNEVKQAGREVGANKELFPVNPWVPPLPNIVSLERAYQEYAAALKKSVSRLMEEEAQ